LNRLNSFNRSNVCRSTLPRLNASASIRLDSPHPRGRQSRRTSGPSTKRSLPRAILNRRSGFRRRPRNRLLPSANFVADVRAAEAKRRGGNHHGRACLRAASSCGSVRWMAQRIHQRLETRRRNFRQWSQRLTRAHPSRRLNEKLQLLDRSATGLLRGVKSRGRECRCSAQFASTFARRVVRATVERRKQNLREAGIAVYTRQIVQRLKGHRNRLPRRSPLRLLSPTNVLEPRYSITRDAATGKVIRDAGEVSQGQPLKRV